MLFSGVAYAWNIVRLWPMDTWHTQLKARHLDLAIGGASAAGGEQGTEDVTAGTEARFSEKTGNSFVGHGCLLSIIYHTGF